MNAIEYFFTPEFKYRKFYKSASHMLASPGSCNKNELDKLKNMGFDADRAENALVLCRNNVIEATNFLKTGIGERNNTNIDITYQECPLLYLVLEIVECFLDIPDHCCICRDKLPDVCLKPSVCNNIICNFALTNIGIGNQVLQEIKRDPLAADLVFSMFACAIGTKFFDPVPPDFEAVEMLKIVKALPSMDIIAKSYNNYAEMLEGLKERPIQLLRWVLLSNRSQLLTLKGNLEMEQFKTKGCRMFMSLLSTPDREEMFRKKKEKHGSIYLWHGSSGERWHSILRNGLINASGTDYQANGAAYGNGIYFARSSKTSIGYSYQTENPYSNSSFGRSFKCVGLCEIIYDKSVLSDFGWCHTLNDELGVVVRFLLVNFDKSIDVIDNPPKYVPTLRDVLEYHAQNAQ